MTAPLTQDHVLSEWSFWALNLGGASSKPHSLSSLADHHPFLGHFLSDAICLSHISSFCFVFHFFFLLGFVCPTSLPPNTWKMTLADKEFRGSTHIFRTETKRSKSSLGINLGTRKTLVGLDIADLQAVSLSSPEHSPSQGDNFKVGGWVPEQDSGFPKWMQMPGLSFSRSQIGPPWGPCDIHFFPLPGLLESCPLIRGKGPGSADLGNKRKWELFGKGQLGQIKRVEEILA